jgi:hypothetical protein
MSVLQMTARYATTCFKCGKSIRPGDRIFWSSVDHKARHMNCEAAGEVKLTRPRASESGPVKITKADGTTSVVPAHPPRTMGRLASAEAKAKSIKQKARAAKRILGTNDRSYR